MKATMLYLTTHPEALALAIIMVVKVVHSLTPTWKAWPSVTKYVGLVLQILAGEQVKK